MSYISLKSNKTVTEEIKKAISDEVELWIPIPGLDGRYEASTHGNIRSVSRFVPVRNGKRWVIGRTCKHMPGRYMGFSCKSEDGVSLRGSVHRLIASMFVANPDGKETVNHINGNKNDNRAVNLEWATLSEQQRHKCRVLKKCIGQNNPGAKLTQEDVEHILCLRAFGATNFILAVAFGVSPKTIQRIFTRRNWVTA